MFLFSFLFGWIVGISTMGINLSPTLWLLIQLFTSFSVIGLLFKCVQFFGNKYAHRNLRAVNCTDQHSKTHKQFPHRSFGENQSVNHAEASSNSIFEKKHILDFLFQFFFGISLIFSGVQLGHQYANHALTQRLEHQVKQLVEHTEIIYVHKLNETTRNAGQAGVKQKVIVVRSDPKQSYEILLYLKNSEEEDALVLGQYYAVTGQLKPTHGYAVAGVFDQEKWFLQQNIMGSMQVRQLKRLTEFELRQLNMQTFLHQQQTGLAKIKLKAEQLRLDFRHLIEQQPLKNKGLLLALLTGDESLLAKHTTEQFRNLGISHLLAISGPHVLIFAVMFCFVIYRIVSAVYPRLYLKIPRPLFLVFPFFICVLAYTAFVGFEIPALRTCLTVCLISLVILFKQKHQALSLLLCSASLLLLLDPFSILSAAFWLSYGACFILIRVYQTVSQSSLPQISVPFLSTEQTADQIKARLKVQSEYVKTWQSQVKLFLWVLIDSQWKVFIALFPLVAIIFQQISWISPVINLIAIPIMGSIVVPLEVLGAFLYTFFPALGLFCFQLADWCISFLLSIFELFEGIFRPKLQWLALSPWMILLIALATIIVFLPRGVVPKGWAVICILGLIFVPKAKTEFELNVIDVGQGQAIFIKLPQNNILIDTGGSFDETRFSIGENVIVPFLMRQGISKLDHVFLTHLDQDHAGAFEKVAQHIEIEQVYSNEQDERFSSHQFNYCQAGMEWTFDQVRIQVLAPNESRLNSAHLDRNESSCVFYIQVLQANGLKNFLIMGDAGWESEYALIQQYPNLAVDVLILGHHGSQHSSSYDFLKRLNPKLSIASAGFDNRYGHPSKIVKSRLDALSISFESTIDAGTLQFKLDQHNNMQMIKHRQTRRWLNSVL